MLLGLALFVSGFSFLVSKFWWSPPLVLLDTKPEFTNRILPEGPVQNPWLYLDDPIDEASQGTNPLEFIEGGSGEPSDWSLAETLIEKIEPNESNSYISRRKRIVKSEDFPHPVLLEEDLIADPLTGEVLVDLKRSMVANQLVVSSNQEIHYNTLENLLEGTDWSIGRISPSRLLAVIETSQLDLNSVTNGIKELSILSNSNDGLSVEPNAVYYALAAPNDPRYLNDQLWGLNSANNNDIDAPEGWDTRTDASDIIIAITDTGIRFDHEDLAGNMWINPLEIVGNEIDDDENGYIDDQYGINVLDTAEPPMDDNGHGTHVAGIAGAVGNNGKGVVGVAWKAKLMALKFLNGSGRGTLGDAIEAIDYAVSNGAKIINASWGGNEFSQALEDSMKRAESKGVFIVAAAGNDGRISNNHYPSDSNLSNVISVGSIDQSGERSPFSNYGIQNVDVMAPGSVIWSTWHTEETAYLTQSGTSMAAPYVAGILALNLAHRPDEDFVTHIDRLLYSSIRRESLAQSSRSQGIVNLAGSLAMDQIPYPPFIVSHSSLTAYQLSGDTVGFEAEVSSDSDVAYEWFFNGNPISEMSEPRLEIEDISEGDEGIYRFVATNENGIASIDFQLTILNPLPNLAVGLDLTANTVISPQESSWSLVQDETSRGGDHIEAFPPEIFERTSLKATVQGPGELRFLWRLSGVYHFVDIPTCHVDGETFEFTSLEGNWQAVSVLLENETPYEITWSFPDANGRYWPDLSKLSIDDLNVYPVGQVPPIIAKQPTGKTVNPLSGVVFRVVASGDNLAYQWHKDNIPIENSDSRSIALNSVTSDDEGLYHVVVSNENGQDTSQTARLYVDGSQTPARFTGSLGPVTGVVGEPFTLSVDHEGTPPIEYRWYKDGISLPRETGPTLNLTPFKLEYEGTYKLEISNEYSPQFPAVSSDWIEVEAIDHSLSPGVIVDIGEPGEFALTNGSELTIRVPQMLDLPTIRYQWYLNDVPIEGEKETTIRIPEVTDENSGTYELEFRNDYGVERSASQNVQAILDPGEALDNPDVLWNPTDNFGRLNPFFYGVNDPSAHGGDSVLFYNPPPYVSNPGQFLRAAISGPQNVSFSWKSNSKDLQCGVYTTQDFNRRIESLVSPIFSGNGDGSWQTITVHVPWGKHSISWLFSSSDPDAIAWLDNVQLSNAPAILKSLPEYIVATSGASTKISVSAFGEGTLNYQWYKNNAPIPGATFSTLEVANGTHQPSDIFHVVVSSEFGESTSTETRIKPLDSFIEVGDQEYSIFGGQTWYYRELNEHRLISIDMLPGDSARIETQVVGPAIAGIGEWYVFGVCKIDGEAVETSLFDTSEGRFTVAYVPEGEHTVSWVFDFDGFSSDTLDIDRLLVEKAPAVFRAGETRLKRSVTYWPDIAAYFFATSPYTATWYKDGEEIAPYLLESGYSRMFDDNHRPNVDDIGTYIFELNDSEGDVSRSPEFVVREVDLLPEGVVLDLPGTRYELVDLDLAKNLSYMYDEAVYIAGDSSILNLVGKGARSNRIVLLGPDIPDGSLTIYELWLKVEGTDEATTVSVASGEMETALSDSTDWQRITTSRNEEDVVINISKSPETELKIWVDAFRPSQEVEITQQPKSYATYLNGKVEFSVEAYALDKITYQWRKNGDDILNAKAQEFSLEALAFEDLGEYDVVITSGSESLISNPAKLTLIDDFGSALGYPGIRATTYGDNLWSIDHNQSADGSSSLVSGVLEPGESSIVRLEFDTPALFSIYSRIHLSNDSSNWSSETWMDNGANPVVEFKANHGERKWIDRLSVSPIPLQSYEKWLTEKIAVENLNTFADTSTLSNPLEDPDGDGISNFFEYALGLDPLSHSDSPQLSTNWDSDGYSGSMDYRLATGGDFSMVFEVSPDLKTWTRIQPNEVRRPSQDGYYHDITSSIHVTAQNHDTLFLRWRIQGLGFEFTPIQSAIPLNSR